MEEINQDRTVYSVTSVLTDINNLCQADLNMVEEYTGIKGLYYDRASKEIVMDGKKFSLTDLMNELSGISLNKDHYEDDVFNAIVRLHNKHVK